MADEPTVDGAADAAPEEELTRLEKAKSVYDLVSDIFTPSRLLLALGGLVVLIVGFVGGWDKVAAVEEAVPTAAPTATATATPFNVTMLLAKHGAELPPIVYPRDGVRYIFLLADVTNMSNQPVGVEVLADAVSIDAKKLETNGAGDVRRPLIYRINDTQSARSLQPGVSTPVALIWAQSAAEPPPETLTVSLNSHTWKKSALEDFDYWQSPTPVVEITMPISEYEAPQ